MKPQKRPLFPSFEGLIITRQFSWYSALNLEVHTAGNILCSHYSAVISSQGRTQAIKSNSLQLELLQGR